MSDQTPAVPADDVEGHMPFVKRVDSERDETADDVEGHVLAAADPEKYTTRQE